MTEQEWLSCETKSSEMMAHVMLKSKATPRKLQLIAAMACRLVIDLEAQAILKCGVDALESYAEGLLPDAEFLAARTAVDQLAEGVQIYRDEVGVVCVARAMSTEMHVGNVSWFVTERAKVRVKRGKKRESQRLIRGAICDILREIVGNPFRPYLAVPSWQGGGVIQPDGRTVLFTDAVKGIADAVHVTGDFGRLPILADALEEAGVTDEVLLSHCRDGGPHLRGCWALDVVRGRA